MGLDAQFRVSCSSHFLQPILQKPTGASTETLQNAIDAACSSQVTQVTQVPSVREALQLVVPEDRLRSARELPNAFQGEPNVRNSWQPGRLRTVWVGPTFGSSLRRSL